MDERSVALNHKPIQARSKHQIGDMYIHKKHKFIIRIVGRGEWSGRLCEVVKGEVPEIVKQRAKIKTQYIEYNSDAGTREYKEKLMIDYSTCALVNCFDRLKSGQVLFG